MSLPASHLLFAPGAGCFSVQVFSNGTRRGVVSELILVRESKKHSGNVIFYSSLALQAADANTESYNPRLQPLSLIAVAIPSSSKYDLALMHSSTKHFLVLDHELGV